MQVYIQAAEGRIGRKTSFIVFFKDTAKGDMSKVLFIADSIAEVEEFAKGHTPESFAGQTVKIGEEVFVKAIMTESDKPVSHVQQVKGRSRGINKDFFRR